MGFVDRKSALFNVSYKCTINLERRKQLIKFMVSFIFKTPAVIRFWNYVKFVIVTEEQEKFNCEHSNFLQWTELVKNSSVVLRDLQLQEQMRYVCDICKIKVHKYIFTRECQILKMLQYRINDIWKIDFIIVVMFIWFCLKKSLSKWSRGKNYW